MLLSPNTLLFTQSQVSPTKCYLGKELLWCPSPGLLYPGRSGWQFLGTVEFQGMWHHILHDALGNSMIKCIEKEKFLEHNRRSDISSERRLGDVTLLQMTLWEFLQFLWSLPQSLAKFLDCPYQHYLPSIFLLFPKSLWASVCLLSEGKSQAYLEVSS